MKKLKILMLVRDFASVYPKHQFKIDMLRGVERYADVRYWCQDGHLEDIIRVTKFEPDFIFHYDIGWAYSYAPRISGLNERRVPLGCFVNDVHNPMAERTNYFDYAKPDLIFATYKRPFLQFFPQYKKLHRWWPFGINPAVFKDYKLKKDIDLLLMGLVYDKNNPEDVRERGMWNNRYPFREYVLNKLRNEEGFVYNRHPGHFSRNQNKTLVNEKYAREINRSKIFFTCGGVNQYAVAKFFEAPACKSLLMAYPNEDIYELGFKDGKNFVACGFEDLFEKTSFYLNNEEARDKIAISGYEFVHQYHTSDQRARQFIAYINDFFRN